MLERPPARHLGYPPRDPPAAVRRTPPLDSFLRQVAAAFEGLVEAIDAESIRVFETLVIAPPLVRQGYPHGSRDVIAELVRSHDLDFYDGVPVLVVA